MLLCQLSSLASVSIPRSALTSFRKDRFELRWPELQRGGAASLHDKQRLGSSSLSFGRSLGTQPVLSNLSIEPIVKVCQDSG